MVATADAATRAAVEKFLKNLKAKMPDVYNKMVENLVVQPAEATKQLGFVLSDIDFSSFTSAIDNVAMPTVDYSSAPTSGSSSGGWFSGLADGLTGMLNSSGFSNVLNMMTPFVNTAVQRNALGVQMQQLQAGLPLYRPAQVYSGGVVASNAMSSLTNYMPYILGGVGLLIAVSMLSKSR